MGAIRRKYEKRLMQGKCILPAKIYENGQIKTLIS